MVQAVRHNHESIGEDFHETRAERGRHRSRKEPFAPGRPGRTRQDHFTEALGARGGEAVYGEAAAGAGRDGGVWRGTLWGAAMARAGPRGEIDGAAIRETLCEDEQK